MTHAPLLLCFLFLNAVWAEPQLNQGLPTFRSSQSLLQEAQALAFSSGFEYQSWARGPPCPDPITPVNFSLVSNDAHSLD